MIFEIYNQWILCFFNQLFLNFTMTGNLIFDICFITTHYHGKILGAKLEWIEFKKKGCFKVQLWKHTPPLEYMLLILCDLKCMCVAHYQLQHFKEMQRKSIVAQDFLLAQRALEILRYVSAVTTMHCGDANISVENSFIKK